MIRKAITGVKTGFCLISLLLIAGCFSRNHSAVFSRKISIEPQDTNKVYNVDLFARLPYGVPAADIEMIIEIVTPRGKRYRDTIVLPVTEGKEINNTMSGVWRDISWPYRKGVRLNSEGDWIFNTMIRESAKRSEKGIVSGVKISVIENGKR